MKRLALATLIAATIGITPTPANAKTHWVKQCGGTYSGRTHLYAGTGRDIYPRTSCPFAWATFRAVRKKFGNSIPLHFAVNARGQRLYARVNLVGGIAILTIRNYQSYVQIVVHR